MSLTPCLSYPTDYLGLNPKPKTKNYCQPARLGASTSAPRPLHASRPPQAATALAAPLSLLPPRACVQRGAFAFLRSPLPWPCLQRAAPSARARHQQAPPTSGPSWHWSCCTCIWTPLGTSSTLLWWVSRGIESCKALCQSGGSSARASCRPAQPCAGASDQRFGGTCARPLWPSASCS